MKKIQKKRKHKIIETIDNNNLGSISRTFLGSIIVISLINDFYATGKQFVFDKSPFEIDENLGEIEKKIVQILDKKIRPAVAKDGGDINFKEFKD